MATVTAQQLYAALTGAGISGAAAIGIMANAANESGGGVPTGPYNLDATGDGGCSHGLLQWNTCGGGYQSMAGASLQQQIDYIKQTVPSTCLQGTDPQTIAGCIASQFERCVGCQPGGAQYNSRVQNAAALQGQNFAPGTGQAQQNAAPPAQPGSGASPQASGQPGPGGPAPGQATMPTVTGARGGPCQFAWTFSGFNVPVPAIQTPLGAITFPGAQDSPGGGKQFTGVGKTAVCFDGVVGVGAWALGIVSILLAAVVVARRPIERVSGPLLWRTPVGQLAFRLHQQRLAEQQARGTEIRRERLQRLEARGRYRPARSTTGLSVQQLETYTELRRETVRRKGKERPKYSPVQARRAAQAAGHTGTAAERVRAARRHLGVKERKAQPRGEGGRFVSVK